ncbi:MAG: guanylate kinase [Coriobacteriia bacterium]|nr:guanylate kinase [Coriobacteriia bacterium]
MKISRLFVISGPSGAGKGTLVSLLRAKRPDLALSISATTRHPRSGEIDGKDYYFLTDDEFDDLIAQHGFVEWAHVHAHRYGTLQREVKRHLEGGHSLILEIDPQGAFQVKENVKDAVLIFITPPSPQILEERLRKRGTESERDIQIRLANMPGELEASKNYNVIIENDDLEKATQALLDAIASFEEKSE